MPLNTSLVKINIFYYIKKAGIVQIYSQEKKEIIILYGQKFSQICNIGRNYRKYSDAG
jgi:hypothetical protein